MARYRLTVLAHILAVLGMLFCPGAHASEPAGSGVGAVDVSIQSAVAAVARSVRHGRPVATLAFRGIEREASSAVARAGLRLPPELAGGLAVDLPARRKRPELEAFGRESRTPLPSALEVYGRGIAGFLVAVAVLLAWMLRRAFPGTGGLEVRIPNEGSTEGSLQRHHVVASIHLTPERPNGASMQDDERPDPRFHRGMVGSGTEFAGLPPGDYRVEVRRVFRHPKTGEVACLQSEDQRVRISRGRPETLRFDFANEPIAIEVAVFENGRALVDGGALVGLKGHRDSQKCAPGGTLPLAVQRGESCVLLGYEDRLFMKPIIADSPSRRVSVRFDVDREEGLAFSGCEPAVEAILQGDRESAMRALERVGKLAPASLLRAEVLRDRGARSEVSAECESAGRFHEAAEIAENAGDCARAAVLFEQAGDFEKAAALFRSDGDVVSAIRVYESARDFDNAIACAFQVGDRPKAVSLMEKSGAYFDAGREALEMHEVDLAIRLFQKIAVDDGNYGEACITLTQLFVQRGEPELALQKLDEAVTGVGSDGYLELREQVAGLLEEKGLLDLALAAFEGIRKRDVDYPGVAEKIAALRAKVGSSTPRVVSDVIEAVPESMEALEGRYEILGELGRGAMGIVYQARDRRLGRVIALKRLPDNLKEHPTAVRLFLREARAAAALNHGNIVTLFDADEEGGVYYLTMEYMDGLPLDKVISKRGRLSVRDTLRISLQISNGLEYAHSEQIIHRDVKPANLFYTRKRQLKIMDFGLAKVVEEVRRATSLIGGTPYYMAPEQAVGDFCDHRADQYAFGVTIFQLVTGRVPFDEGDVTYHHRHTPVPDPREFAAEVPGPMAEMILRMMAKDVDARYDTSEDVTQTIDHLLRGVE